MKNLKLEISLKRKLEIIDALKQDISITNISRYFGVSRQSIYKIKNRFNEGGEANLASRNSRPINIRKPNQKNLKIVKKRCIERPSFGAVKLSSFIKERDCVNIPTSTISFYLRVLQLHNSSKRAKALELMYKNSTKSINKFQFRTMVKYNPCYLDKDWLESNSKGCFQVGYIEMKNKDQKHGYFSFCINVRTGEIFARIDDEIDVAVLMNLTRIVLCKIKTSAIIMLLNKRFAILEPHIVNMCNDEVEIQALRYNQKFKRGMSIRFRIFFNAQMKGVPAGYWKLNKEFKGNRENYQDVLAKKICKNWNKEKLYGFPIYDKRPVN